MHPPSRREITALVIVIGVIAGLLYLALSVLPEELAGPSPRLDEPARLKAISDARGHLIQALGGLALLGGLYFTKRSYDLSRSGQVTERFTKAVESSPTTANSISDSVGSMLSSESRATRRPIYLP